MHLPRFESTPSAFPMLGFMPPKQLPLLIATFIVCAVCSTPMVWTRLFVHFFVIKIPRWDDGILIAAWLGFVAFGVGLVLSFTLGPTDDPKVTEHHLTKLKQYIWMMEMTYPVVIFCAKLTVLMLYKRIFIPPHGKKTWVYYTILFFLVFNALYYFANLVVVALNCIPTQKIWDPSTPGQCINLYTVFIGTAVLNVLSDSFMAIVPVAVVLKLQMSRKRKIETMCVFAFGVICIITALFRLAYSVLGMWEPNQGLAILKIALWCLAEITACLITASVPMVPLMLRYCQGMTTNSKTASRPSVPTQERSKPRQRTPETSLFEDTYMGGDDSSSYSIKRRQSSTADSELTHISRIGTSPIGDTNIIVSRTVEVSFVPKSM